MTMRTFHFILSLALLLIALLFGYALSRMRTIAKARCMSKSEPIVPIACEYPDDSEFWAWYNDLIANVDVTYAEARAWYALRTHEDVSHMTGEPMTVEPDGMV